MFNSYYHDTIIIISFISMCIMISSSIINTRRVGLGAGALAAELGGNK